MSSTAWRPGIFEWVKQLSIINAIFLFLFNFSSSFHPASLPSLLIISDVIQVFVCVVLNRQGIHMVKTSRVGWLVDDKG